MAPVTSIFDRIREKNFDMRYKPILDNYGRAFRKLKKTNRVIKYLGVKVIIKNL